MLPDHYKTLKVRRDADLATIKKSHRSLIKKYHDDKPESKKDPEAAKKAQEINWAWNVLKDEKERQKYNKQWDPVYGRSASSAVPDASPSSTKPDLTSDIHQIAFGDVRLGSTYNIRFAIHCTDGGLELGAPDIRFHPFVDGLECVADCTGGAGSLRIDVAVIYHCPYDTSEGAINSSLLVSYGGAELNISITANIILDEVSFADYDGAPIGNSVYGAPPSGSSTGYHGGPVPPPKPPVSSRNILLYSAIAIIGLIILSISVRGFMNFLYARQAENSQVAQSQGSVNIPPGLDNQSIQTRLLSASYSSDCVKQYPDAGFSRVITVKNGIWDNGREESDKRASFQIVGKKVILANLTGNGRQEAVVETYCGMENQTLGYEEIYVIDPSSKSMKVLQKFSPRDWGESSLGITWSMTGVEAEDGELRVGYRLGGSHAQPDWNATTGFRWNGRHFVRVNFEARGESGEAHEHQSIQKVMPIDEAYRDSTLVTFRDDLLAAVKRRDANYLYQTVSPTMVVGFGAEANTREEFIKAWNMTAPDSKLWSVLLQVLQNGGTFVDFNGRQQYVARSTFGAWPKSVDSFEHCAVIAPQASMYSLPDTGSTVIKTLSYDVVKPDSSALCTQDQEWIKVSTGTGDSGFIQTKALRSPIDYRAAFEKIDGRWIMTSLVAGD